MKKAYFNDDFNQTQAVINGTKTQFRQIVPQKALDAWDDIDDGDEYSRSVYAASYEAKMRNFLLEYAQYKVGEVVAIAQSYKSIHDMALDDDVNINADMVCIEMLKHAKSKGWTNKMFVKSDLMPYRIRIEKIRVERLQDISEEDCLAEGIIKYANGVYTYIEDGKKFFRANLDTPKKAFADLIDRINGKGTWETNPFVYVNEFKLVK